MDMDVAGDFIDLLGFDFANSFAAASPGPSAASSSGASEPEITTISRRRPIPKKGHTKSRRGCQSCKRRKVKCQETLPECANCKRLGLNCVYPGPSISSTPTPPPTTALQSTPGVFTMEDLRFFHHFLVTAYPPLPMGGDAVWKGVAALSHQYDYLVHAMLGLAASHLNLYTGNWAEQALAHRVKAIQSLNQTLSKPCTSSAEGDARFGAIMALTFQASCMPEGMTEFLAMTRGCQIVFQTGMVDFTKSLFQDFTVEGYPQSVKRVVGEGEVPPDAHQQALLDDFIVSLRRLAPLLSSPLEIRFLAATERVTKMVKMSAVDAFSQFAAMYNIITSATNEEFIQFTEPTNYPAQLLLLYFTMIEFAIGELTLGQVGVGARFGFRRRASLAWLNGLLETVPAEYQHHLEWPLKYAAHLVTGLTSSYVIPNAHPSVMRLLESPSSHNQG